MLKWKFWDTLSHNPTQCSNFLNESEVLQVGLDPGSVGMVRLLHLRLQRWIMNDYEITKERTWLWSVMDMRWVWELLVGFTMIRMSQKHERISILSMRAWEGDKITRNRTFVGLETASLGMVHQEMALSGEPLKWPSYEPLIHWNPILRQTPTESFGALNGIRCACCGSTRAFACCFRLFHVHLPYYSESYDTYMLDHAYNMIYI
jgi:hypothetical protein